MLVDYHVHVLAHGEYNYNLQWVNQYIDTAYQKGIREIGFSEHDEYTNQIAFDLFKKMQTTRRHDINLKLGIEMDYTPGKEEIIKDIIAQREYDYVIGSVHYINGWGFDHPDFKAGFDHQDIDKIYGQYTGILMQMVQSGCFDVVGHIDLIKIWGYRPRQKPSLYYFEPVLRAIKKYGLAVEINSAGLRKPVSELYPAAEIVSRMFDYSIPITFGSDAHHPGQIGEGLEEAYHSAWQAGYRYMVRFERREKIITAIEY